MDEAIDTKSVMRHSHWNARGAALRSYGAVLALALASGCCTAPRRASQVMGDTPNTASGVDGATLAGDPRLSAGFWKQQGALAPSVALARGRRVVVTAFEVELVELQFQPRTPLQLMFKPPVIVAVSNPIGWAFIPIGVMDAIGVGRKMTELAVDQQRTLAADLYTGFLQVLGRRGLEVLPHEALLASPSYVGIPRLDVAISSPLMLLNPVGIDTGQVLRTRIVAAPGLGVSQLPVREQEPAELRILQETSADVAVTVRLRVGLFRGKPALEQRSVICLTSREGSTTLRARHSLTSDRIGAERANFRPLLGRIQRVDPKAFSSELTGMLPEFVGLALVNANP
jgi:hypothetical protein